MFKKPSTKKIYIAVFISFLCIASFAPFILGEQKTIAVYDSGRARNSQKFYTTVDYPNDSLKDTGVVRSYIPSTIGQGDQRVAYKFIGLYWLTGVNFIMLLSIGVFMTLCIFYASGNSLVHKKHNRKRALKNQGSLIHPDKK